MNALCQVCRKELAVGAECIAVCSRCWDEAEIDTRSRWLLLGWKLALRKIDSEELSRAALPS